MGGTRLSRYTRRLLGPLRRHPDEGLPYAVAGTTRSPPVGSPWLQARRLHLPRSEHSASASLTSTSDINNGRQQQLRAAPDGHAFQASEDPEAPLIELLKRCSLSASLGAQSCLMLVLCVCVLAVLCDHGKRFWVSWRCRATTLPNPTTSAVASAHPTIMNTIEHHSAARCGIQI